MNKNSIDEDEVRKFDKMATGWWNGKEFDILHRINPIRLDYILSKINSHFSDTDTTNLKILDVGCGGGLASIPLSNKGFYVTGIDASEKTILEAKEYAKSQDANVEFLSTSIEKIAVTNQKYDIVLALEIIEHVDDLQSFADNIAKVMKEDGILILSTLNRNIKSYILGIIFAEYILNFVPRGTHQHSKFLKPSEMYDLFEPHGLKLHELKGLTFDILNNSWYLSDNLDVNYFAYFSFREL